MTGIKRLGTWNSNPFGTIWQTEDFEDADRCVMCIHQIPHSRSEHDKVLADGGKIKCTLTGKLPQINASHPEYWVRRRTQDRQKREKQKLSKAK